MLKDGDARILLDIKEWWCQRLWFPYVESTFKDNLLHFLIVLKRKFLLKTHFCSFYENLVNHQSFLTCIMLSLQGQWAPSL